MSKYTNECVNPKELWMTKYMNECVNCKALWMTKYMRSWQLYGYVH